MLESTGKCLCAEFLKWSLPVDEIQKVWLGKGMEHRASHARGFLIISADMKSRRLKLELAH